MGLQDTGAGCKGGGLFWAGGWMPGKQLAFLLFLYVK